MADRVVETVSLAAATGGGNQTFTFSAAMGTPKGAIFRVTKQVTDQDTSAADAIFSEGYADASSEFNATSQGDDASAREDTDSMQSASEVIRILVPGGTVDGEANFNGFGANTVGITWGNAPAGAYLITCTAYGGTDVTCVAGNTSIATAIAGTATITDSQERDLLHVASTGNSTMDVAQDNFNMSVGCAHFTSGAIVQACHAYVQDEFAANGTPSAICLNNRVAHDLVQNGAVDWALEVTAQTSTTITITTRDSSATGGTEIGWLSVKLTDGAQGDRCAIGNITSPVASGNWSITAPGFKPQHVMLGLTDTPTINVAAASVPEGGTYGVSMVDTAEFCLSVTDENGAATMNCRSHFRGRAIWLRADDDASTLYDLAFSSFDATGWTYSQTGTPSATAKQFWYVAVEEEAAGGSITEVSAPQGMMLASQGPTIEAAVATSVNVDNAVALLIRALDPTLLSGVTIRVDTQPLILQLQAPTIQVGASISVQDPLALVLQPHGPNIETGSSIVVEDPLGLLLSPQGPAVQSGVSVSVSDVGVITLAVPGPTIRASTTIGADVEAPAMLILSPLGPTIDTAAVAHRYSVHRGKGTRFSRGTRDHVYDVGAEFVSVNSEDIE